MIDGKLYKTRFAEIGFTLNSPGDWRFVDLSDAQDGNKANMHCIGASYPTREQLLSNVERYAAQYGCEGASKPTPPAEVLARIAKTHLYIDTLEAQGRDGLDFHDCHVNQIKAALQDAWECGKLAQ